MNPGDLYHDPNRPRQSGGYTSPNRAQFPHSQSQPFAPPVHVQPPASGFSHPLNPFDPPPQSTMQHSQSQPFYPNQGYDQQPQQQYDQYGNAFGNAPNAEAQWGQQPTPNPPHMSPGQHRMSLPAAPSGALSPSHSAHPLEPPRTRFDSNPSFLNPPPSGMDHRLMTPPPLLQQHSSASDMSFPNSNRQSFGAPMGPGYEDQNDANDSAPLLNHAQPAFGLPHSQTGYTLRDDGMGDMGMRNGGPGQGYSNSSIGFGGVPNGFQAPQAQGMDDDGRNVRYGPVPDRVIRRNRTQKRVK